MKENQIRTLIDKVVETVEKSSPETIWNPQLRNDIAKTVCDYLESQKLRDICN